MVYSIANIAGDFLPAMFCRIEPGGNQIVKMEWPSACTISFQPPGIEK